MIKKLRKELLQILQRRKRFGEFLSLSARRGFFVALWRTVLLCTLFWIGIQFHLLRLEQKTIRIVGFRVDHHVYPSSKIEETIKRQTQFNSQISTKIFRLEQEIVGFGVEILEIREKQIPQLADSMQNVLAAVFATYARGESISSGDFLDLAYDELLEGKSLVSKIWKASPEKETEINRE